MVKIETIKKLEDKFHCMITVDPRHDYLTNKWSQIFTIFSADGMRWACVGNYKMLIKTLKESEVALRRLAGLNYLIKKEAMV